MLIPFLFGFPASFYNCKHKHSETMILKTNPTEGWIIYTYRCKRCGGKPWQFYTLYTKPEAHR